MPRLPFGPKGMRKQFANASSQNLSAGPRAQHLSRESSREVSAQGTGSRSPVCDLHAELRHDVLGAAAAGLDSLFVVESGVHAQDLAEVSEQCVANLAAAEGVPVPTFVMRKFRW